MAAVASSKDDCEDNDVVVLRKMLSLTEVIDCPSEAGLSGFVAMT